MTIGKKIRQCRKDAGLTQTKLAEYAHVHPVSIRKYETGINKPNFETMVRIAIALNLTPCSFCNYYKGEHSFY